MLNKFNLGKLISSKKTAKLEKIITCSVHPNPIKLYWGWLKEPPGHPSPETFLKLMERFEYITGNGIRNGTNYPYLTFLHNFS